MGPDVQTIDVQTHESPVRQETGEDPLSRKEEAPLNLDSTVIIEGPIISLIHNRTTLDDPRDSG